MDIVVRVLDVRYKYRDSPPASKLICCTDGLACENSQQWKGGKYFRLGEAFVKFPPIEIAIDVDFVWVKLIMCARKFDSVWIVVLPFYVKMRELRVVIGCVDSDVGAKGVSVANAFDNGT